MKKTALKSLALKAVSVAIVAVSMANVANAADWTPLLGGMQNSCRFESNLSGGKKTIPKHLRADIVNYDEKYLDDYNESGMTRIDLKNARAFGQPIDKIVVNWDGEAYASSVYFKDVDLKKISQQFFLETNSVDGGWGKDRRYTVGDNQAWVDYFKTTKVGWGSDVVKTESISPPKTKREFERLIQKYSNLPYDSPNGWYDGVEVSGVSSNGWYVMFFGPWLGDESLVIDNRNKTITCGNARFDENGDKIDHYPFLNAF